MTQYELTKEDWFRIWKESLGHYYSDAQIEMFAPINIDEDHHPHSDAAMGASYQGDSPKNIKKALDVPFEKIPLEITKAKGYERTVYLIRLEKGR